MQRCIFAANTSAPITGSTALSCNAMCTVSSTEPKCTGQLLGRGLTKQGHNATHFEWHAGEKRKNSGRNGRFTNNFTQLTCVSVQCLDAKRGIDVAMANLAQSQCRATHHPGSKGYTGGHANGYEQSKVSKTLSVSPFFLATIKC